MPRNVRRPRVLRVLEQSVREGFLVRRGSVDGTGQQSQHRVDDRQRGDLTTRDDVVADRELKVHEAADPLVDTLVAGTHQHEMRPRGRGPCARACSKRSPPGSSRMRKAREPGGATTSSAAAMRLWTQDHAGPAAVGVVVDRTVAAEAPLAQVVRVQLGQAALEGTPGMDSASGPGKMPGKRRDDVDAHQVGSLSCGAARHLVEPWSSASPSLPVLARVGGRVAHLGGGAVRSSLRQRQGRPRRRRCGPPPAPAR